MALENSVSIEAGSKAVVGHVTQFVAAEGDLLIVNGIAAVIAAVTSTSSLTLTKPWPGLAVVESTNWEIRNDGPYWRSTVTTNKLVTELLRKIDGGLPLDIGATGTLAQRAQYNDQTEGFLFLQTDVDPFLLYVKTGLGPTDWSAGQRLRADPAESTQEAKQAAAAAEGFASTANARANAAQTSAGDAAASEGRAHDWAEKPVDQDVTTPGTRSALHHETKAAENFKNFRNSYYGPLPADPTTRPDGSAIQDGDIYYRTTTPTGLKLRNGGAWTVAVFDAAGAMLAANNLSDLTDKPTALGNLGALSSDDGAVTNSKLAKMAAGTIKANITGALAGAVDVDRAAFRGWIGFPYDAVKDGSVDNTGATLAAAALQAALIAAKAAGRPLYIPAGIYDMGAATLSPSDGMLIYGDWEATILRRTVDVGAAAYDGNRPPVIYAIGKTGVTIRDLRIDYTAGTSTAPSGNTYRFSAIVMESCSGSKIRNVSVSGRFYTGISMAYSINWSVADCFVRGVVNRPFYVNGSADNFTFERCVVDGFEVGGSTRFTQYGFNMLPVGTESISRGRLIGCEVRNTTHQGFEWGSRVNDVWAIGCHAYNVGFHGFLFQTANSVIPQFNGAIGCTAHVCGANGFYLLNTNYTVLSGCIGRSNINANFELDGAQYCSLGNLLALSSPGYGIWIKNSVRCGVNNSRVISNNFGLIEANTCTADIFGDNHFIANTTTNVSTLGAGSVASNNL